MTPTTKPYKAVAAFVVTFVSTLLVSIQDKTEFTDLSVLQWVVVVLSSLVSAAVVFGVTNPPATQ